MKIYEDKRGIVIDGEGVETIEKLTLIGNTSKSIIIKDFKIDSDKVFRPIKFNKIEELNITNQLEFDKECYKLFLKCYDNIIKDLRLNDCKIISDTLHITKQNTNRIMMLEVCNCLNSNFHLSNDKEKYLFSCCFEETEKSYKILYRIEVKR